MISPGFPKFASISVRRCADNVYNTDTTSIPFKSSIKIENGGIYPSGRSLNICTLMTQTAKSTTPESSTSVCIWCEKMVITLTLDQLPVCYHCYELLNRAGIEDFEIFGLARKRKDKVSVPEINDPS